MPGAAKKAVVAVVGVAALAVGGSAIANADSSGGGTTTTTASPGATAPPSYPAHGSAAHEDAEKPVTGANADKAKVAAIKAVGGGTAGDVTTDFTQRGYEVTVTKADGSKVEIHLDSSFDVMRGGPHGRPGGPPPPPTFG